MRMTLPPGLLTDSRGLGRESKMLLYPIYSSVTFESVRFLCTVYILINRQPTRRPPPPPQPTDRWTASSGQSEVYHHVCQQEEGGGNWWDSSTMLVWTRETPRDVRNMSGLLRAYFCACAHHVIPLTVEHQSQQWLRCDLVHLPFSYYCYYYSWLLLLWFFLSLL